MSADSDNVVLRFDRVSVSFDEARVLDDISFSVVQGESRIILGSSGSGKTVLLKTALGLLRPEAGRVYAFEQDITDLPEEQLFDIRSKIGMLFQEGGLFDSLTIEENVAYPLLYQRSLKGKVSDIRSRVIEALRFVELEQTLDKFPSELSGGMRRRVGIARALVSEPPLVLYDSPSAGLDPITAYTIITLIVKERDARHAANLMVTHRYQDGNLLANFRYNPDSTRLEPGRNGQLTRFMVLREGRLIFEGSQEELETSTDPYVSKFVVRTK